MNVEVDTFSGEKKGAGRGGVSLWTAPFVRSKQGDNEKALEVLKTGLLLCPESAQIHFELGKVYESLGNIDEAMNQYKKSAECALKLQKKRN